MPIGDSTLDLAGVAAAISTSVLWTFTGLLFAAATRRLGPAAVNTLRLAIAASLHVLTFRLIAGTWWPPTSNVQFWALVLSGVVGLSLCDLCWLTSLSDLGPRRVMLLATTSPVFALLLGRSFLDERVTPWASVGIALTLAGVIWVVLERPHAQHPEARPHATRGVILAILAAALQAAGSLFSKIGMGHGDVAGALGFAGPLEPVSPQAAACARTVFGLLGTIPLLVIAGARAGAILQPSRLPGAPPERSPIRFGLATCAIGALTGPYLGVWLSLIAFDRAPLGIAQTLLSLQPVLVLPLAAWFFNDRITFRAAGGALLAVAGSIVLALLGGST
ncbi:MAG: DMT family transporter [Phycisphaerales bacterium]